MVIGEKEIAVRERREISVIEFVGCYNARTNFIWDVNPRVQNDKSNSVLQKGKTLHINN